MKRFFWVAVAAVLLTGCDMGFTPKQEADYQSGLPVKITQGGPFTAYIWRIKHGDQIKTLYIVPNTTVTYNCGKSCNDTVTSPGAASADQGQIVAALNRLSPEDRAVLGLPDPRAVALSKLTPQERVLLGLENE